MSHNAAVNSTEIDSDFEDSTLNHDHDGEVVVHDDPAEGDPNTWTFSWRRFVRFVGPGLLMSIAYIDPGNIESDLQSGIYAGYTIGWVLLLSTVIGLLLQALALRQGVVMGKQLAQVCREEYPRKTSMALWLCIELAIVGSDIQEVVGSAVALQLLFGLPLYVGVLLTGFDTFTFLLLERFGIRKLEAVFLALIGTMTVAFLTVFFIGKPDYGGIGLGLVYPIVRRHAVIQAVGTLGAVIMPHNLFLHSALVQSRKVDRSKRGRLDEAVFMFTLEAAFSLAVSFFINLAIMSVFARHFHLGLNADCQGVPCKDVGLKEAGIVLERGFGGKAGKIIWGIGLLAAGQSSTMTGTFAGQYTMNGFLNLKLSLWKRTLLTRSIAVVPAVIVAVLAQSFFDSLDEWLNCLQSLVLPAALLPLLAITSSPQLMGPYRNSRLMSVSCWTLTFIVVVTNFYLVGDFAATSFPHTWWVYLLLAVFAVLYLAGCAHMLCKRVGQHVGDPAAAARERRASQAALAAATDWEAAGGTHRTRSTGAWWTREAVTVPNPAVASDGARDPLLSKF